MSRQWTVCSSWCGALLLLGAAAFTPPATEAVSSVFDDNFVEECAPGHFRTSPDGQVWYLYLDNTTGCGFQTKNRYQFGWFSMKLKLVGGDSAGVVTAYYMCSDLGAGSERDEVDIEFLGNRSGNPYTIQTNIYKSGVGGREMRHMLWFDPTQDFHTYSILWNSHRIVFFVDQVAIRVFKNDPNNSANVFFPNSKPMYLFSSIWNADDWATRGGLEKTNWTYAPFVSSYTDFKAQGCHVDGSAADMEGCVDATSTQQYWWDQSGAWVLTGDQQEDFDWVGRNLVIYNYCQDFKRYPVLPPECAL